MAGKMKRFLAVGVVVLATAALAWAGTDSQPKAGSALKPDILKPVITKAIKGEQCVEPTEYMRRNHMEVLDGHRDEAVIEGIRTKKYSLKECINCHASEKTGSVAAAQDDFCISCHSYASVKIDCFECHASRPKGSVALHSLNAQTAHFKHKLAANANATVSVEEMIEVAK